MASRGSTLVVVESPAKAKTIKKYLGTGYQVLASKGHVWDLPKKFGIDIDKGFQETYEVIEGKEKTLKEIKDAAKEVDAIMLATDPDREGEAIAFHLAQELKNTKKPTKRVLFTEITKRGVKDGVEHPRDLDSNLYDAQRCRRVLDRIVGYDVSSLVWSKLAFGLSAGRVQTVALRLIVDREREIEAFVPEEYWNLAARLGARAGKFTARLHTWDGKPIAKEKIGDGDTARRVQSELKSAKYKVVKVTRAERQRKAPAPYTTSKLQQDAANILRFPAKRTMQIAQGLYEGVELGKEMGSVGLITYMRTDSVRVSDDAITAVRDYIEQSFGKQFMPGSPNVFKSRKSAQEAHEAIRPTSMELPPEKVAKYLKPEQLKLYRLIWNRFVASQMVPAVYDQTTVDIDATAASGSAAGGTGVQDKVVHNLRASGRVLKFGGWLEAYAKKKEPDEEVTELAGEDEGETLEEKADKAPEKEDEAELPPIEEGETLSLVDPPGVTADQKFTQPPPRYNEGSLVRALEERGIGRPSTYAEIINKVQARDYVEKPDGRTFKATELGKMVVDGLVQAALDFMDPEFTAKMEEELDLVEAGELPRAKLLESFYKRFKKQLESAKKLKRWTPDPEPSEVSCDICGKPMLKRWSKRGWFLGCSGYPKCKGIKSLAIGADGQLEEARQVITDYKCDVCGKPMAIRTGRYGQFLSCTGYPECKNAQPVPLGVKCPKCKTGDLIEIRPAKRGGRTFYGCSNYKSEAIKCDFKLWAKPFPEPCPNCHAEFLVRGGTKNKPMIQCVTEGCGFKREPTEEELSGGTTPRLEASSEEASA